jgi:heme exporter protein A
LHRSGLATIRRLMSPPKDPPAAWAVEATGLSKRFGRTWALANVTFRVPVNSVFLVAGKNGSGKTTLFRVLTTAIRADAGSASVGGVDLRERNLIRRRTALLSHHAYAYESLSAAENLLVFAHMLGAPRGIVPALLEQVGLSPVAGEPMSSFSAGMRRRVALARLLLQIENACPEVIFLDEPYAALDPEGVALIDRLVQRLRTDGRTVVIVSHQLEHSAPLATHAALLESGRLVWEGVPRELLSRIERSTE